MTINAVVIDYLGILEKWKGKFSVEDYLFNLSQGSEEKGGKLMQTYMDCCVESCDFFNKMSNVLGRDIKEEGLDEWSSVEGLMPRLLNVLDKYNIEKRVLLFDGPEEWYGYVDSKRDLQYAFDVIVTPSGFNNFQLQNYDVSLINRIMKSINREVGEAGVRGLIERNEVAVVSSRIPFIETAEEMGLNGIFYPANSTGLERNPEGQIKDGRSLVTRLDHLISSELEDSESSQGRKLKDKVDRCLERRRAELEKSPWLNAKAGMNRLKAEGWTSGKGGKGNFKDEGESDVIPISDEPVHDAKVKKANRGLGTTIKYESNEGNNRKPKGKPDTDSKLCRYNKRKR